MSRYVAAQKDPPLRRVTSTPNKQPREILRHEGAPAERKADCPVSESGVVDIFQWFTMDGASLKRPFSAIATKTIRVVIV